MNVNLSELPIELPVPIDDGAASHLVGCALPNLCLPSTDGGYINLEELSGCWVIYIYPMTGVPGVPLPDNWDEIPGARGCTPQSCSFRDHHAELNSLNAGVMGLSTQTTEYQQEVQKRLHLPFQLLSDNYLKLKDALNLPTFSVDNMELYKRLTMIVRDGLIIKVFYPVFPPDQNADNILDWLRCNKNISTK
jgi:peroxiredoxin